MSEDLAVTPGPATTDRAEVHANFKAADGTPIRVNYTLVQNQGAWRVAEMAHPGDPAWSLRQLLSLPPLAR